MCVLTCFFVGYTCLVQLDKIGDLSYPVDFEFRAKTAAVPSYSITSSSDYSPPYNYMYSLATAVKYIQTAGSVPARDSCYVTTL